VVARTPEGACEFCVRDGFCEAWINQQPIVVAPGTKDILDKQDGEPCGGAGPPRIAGVSVDVLAA